jgi:hypothetical protein
MLLIYFNTVNIKIHLLYANKHRIVRSNTILSGAVPATPTSAFSIFSGVLVAPSLVFCVLFCESLFVLLSFFAWPYYYKTHTFRR